MSRLLYKQNVKPYSLRIACFVINIANEFNFPNDIVITSGNDSKHKDNSLHYSDNALDIRSKNFPSEAAKDQFLSILRGKLGADYDILLEGRGTVNEHFHIEYDPDGIH